MFFFYFCLSEKNVKIKLWTDRTRPAQSAGRGPAGPSPRPARPRARDEVPSHHGIAAAARPPSHFWRRLPLRPPSSRAAPGCSQPPPSSGFLSAGASVLQALLGRSERDGAVFVQPRCCREREARRRAAETKGFSCCRLSVGCSRGSHRPEAVSSWKR